MIVVLHGGPGEMANMKRLAKTGLPHHVIELKLPITVRSSLNFAGESQNILPATTEHVLTYRFTHYDGQYHYKFTGEVDGI